MNTEFTGQKPCLITSLPSLNNGGSYFFPNTKIKERLMKKLLTLLISLIMLFSVCFSFGCGEDDGGALKVYVPDGAPALSVAKLLADGNSDYDINVVVASTINTYVTGDNPLADICIMPINAAVKALGNGNTYTLLGTVTHGNLFILKKGDAPDITESNISYLIGKKVGVINLSAVPGLTFKAILSDKNIEFTTLGETNGTPSVDKVNLVGLADGTQVIPGSECDYFVVPEPALSTKIKATSSAPVKLSKAGSLQDLYGNGEGYPQAVVVVRNSVLQEKADKVNEFINSFNENTDWLNNETTTSEQIVNAVTAGFLNANTAPTFSANNLTKEVISNCAIRFAKASEDKQNILDYMAKVNAVSNNAFGTPVNEFFYQD